MVGTEEEALARVVSAMPMGEQRPEQLALARAVAVEAWVSLRLFVELNDWTWDPRPSIDDAERAVLAIAAGEWNEAAVAEWLRGHLTPPAGGPTE